MGPRWGALRQAGLTSLTGWTGDGPQLRPPPACTRAARSPWCHGCPVATISSGGRNGRESDVVPWADQSALLGVALAAAISVSAAEGPWELIESVVGVVLLAVLWAFYPWNGLKGSLNGDRVRGRQRYAVAGVVGLCCTLIPGWPLQAHVPTKWMLPAVWLIAAVVTCVVLSRRRPTSEPQ